MSENVQFDPELIRKHDVQGPRYTSYPTVPQFREDFSEEDYLSAAARSNASGRRLSLYVHIPFCDTVCFYCACNKVITRNRKRADEYLEHLYREIDRQAALFDGDRPVDQLHFGGGTPTFISDAQMETLMQRLGAGFLLHENGLGEYSIEIDPRTVDVRRIARLRSLGFNRLSMGVQDFNPAVQVAVNRIQSRRVTLDAISAAREEGFYSINLDLIYGLPLQTVSGFRRTLNEIIQLAPDRLAVYNYAHLPELFKVQRQIDSRFLPSAEDKLAILQQAVEQLTEAGYVYIGMDHFARPDDDLAKAQRDGTLQRNFQGYSTGAGCDLIGLGVSAIGSVDDCYYQNFKDVPAYHRSVNGSGLALWRGLCLDKDDRLRRTIIHHLMCDSRLDTRRVADDYDIDFPTYFSAELRRLSDMQADGLVEIDGDQVRVTPAGRLLVRNVCMVFDRYLGNRENRYSRAV